MPLAASSQWDWLGTITRINAARAGEKQAFDARLKRGLDHVALNGEVVGEESRRVRVIGKDSADFRPSEKDVLGP